MKARILLLAAFTAACALSLCSCGFFLSGLFPGDLAQATARWILPAEVPAEVAQKYSLAILGAGTNDYIVLFTSLPYSGTQLFVLDQHLAELQTWSDTELNDVLPPAPFQGSGAMTDTGGDFVIGNVRFAPGTDGLSDLGKAATTIWNSSAATTNLNLVNINTDGGTTLRYDAYDDAWAFLSTVEPSVSKASGSSFWVQGAVTAPAETWVMLGISESASNHTDAHFVRIPKTDFEAGLLVPLLSHYPTITWKDVDVSSLAYAPQGLVVYERRSGDLVEIPVGAPAEEMRVHIGSFSGNVQIAVSPTGTYYCVWSPSTRSLTRMESWWPQ